MHNNWAETLADFLKRQPNVGAVRIDTVSRKVSVATVGAVDHALLEARLVETIAAIEAQLAQEAPAPAGYKLRREGAMTEIAGESDVTATKFWQWREFTLPAILGPAEALEPEEPEWKELAIFASVCAGFGLGGFVVETMRLGPAWLGHALFAVALIAGGWDAAKDTWENLRRVKIDIHFLMLAVAMGAACIGAWG